MKLSIIIPYYNCLIYIKELFKVLEPQLNDKVEVIVVDDGCHEKELDKFKAKVIHLEKNSGCAGVPRNYGLDVAKGEYITFIDADDFVSNDFIEKILNKINESDFDYCLMSWKHFPNCWTIDVSNGRPEWNCSVWGIVFKKDLIGNKRFNNLKFAEDYDFYHKVLSSVKALKKETITDVLYYYRQNPNGLTVSHGKEV